MVNSILDSSHTHLEKALFLDRDGVTIEYIPYLSRPDQVKVPIGAGSALKYWQDQGYHLIVITNQSGVSRGYFTLDDVHAIHDRMIAEYQKFGVTFTDILICPHHPDDGCDCRKPSPYMILEAAKRHQIALSQSFFIGDAPSDITCAIQAGCQPILLLTGIGQETRCKIGEDNPNIPIFEQLSDTIELIS